MSDIAIRVEGLGKKYNIGRKRSGDFRESFSLLLRKLQSNTTKELNKNDFWALKDINFEVKKGDAVGIIGRNGAGKSTLLKILSRITKPTIGRFEINGRVSSLLEVGTGFHSELTGRENIFLNGTILGMKRREIKEKFNEIVAFSGVEKFIDTPVKHYSSGMKVRLAFSVAAHLEPEILIIDEVLAVGDAEFQKKCLGKMEDVAGKGRTVLFVSHNMGAIKSLCHSTIILNQGKIDFTGNVINGIAKYISSNFFSLSKIQESNIEKQPDELIVKEISLINSRGSITNVFDAGEDWFLKLKIVVHTRLSHFIAAIGILTMEDLSVRTIYSSPHSLSPGNYLITFSINDVYFASQKYKVTVGLSEREQAIISVKDKLSFEINNNANKSEFYKTDPKFGFIINKTGVTFEKR